MRLILNVSYAVVRAAGPPLRWLVPRHASDYDDRATGLCTADGGGGHLEERVWLWTGPAGQPEWHLWGRITTTCTQSETKDSYISDEERGDQAFRQVGAGAGKVKRNRQTMGVAFLFARDATPDSTVICDSQ